MKVCVFDLETTISQTIFGSESRHPDNKYCTLIYGHTPDTINVLHEEQTDKSILPASVCNAFADADIIVGHNLLFDLGYIWHSGAWQRALKDDVTIWDCQLAEYLTTGQRHKFASLAELQEKYLGIKIKEDRISQLYKKGIGADKIIAAQARCPRLWKLYNKYCHDDGATTLQIFAKQWRRAKELYMLPILQAHMRGLLGIGMMQNTGMYIDSVRCEQTLRDFKLESISYLKQAAEKIQHLWDNRLPAFNINSPKHKSAILFGGSFEINEKIEDGTYKNGNLKYKTVKKLIHISGFNLSPEYTQPSKVEGRYVTDAAVLHKIGQKCPDEQAKKYCLLQQKAMNYEKMCSTYLRPFLDYSIDGVLRPHYNVALTETGRLSASKPNMQNIPSSGPMGQAVQSLIVAPSGWVCVDIDYSQLEVYVLAMLSQDKQLIQDLDDGVCLHCRRLSWIPRLSEGKTYEEIYRLAKIEEHPDWVGRRKKAKGISFKKAYGGGARSLAEAENLNVEDVQALFDREDEIYWGVKQFNDRLFETVNNSSQQSYRGHFSMSAAKGKVFAGSLEMLPVFQPADNKTYYKQGEYRQFGTYISPIGRRFCFEQYGRYDWHNKIRIGYSPTETKNYHIQGTAADVVQTILGELVYYVAHNDRHVKMVRQIHDSIGFYVREDMKNVCIPALLTIMSSVRKYFMNYFNYDPGLDFKVEAKIGPNFAEMNHYEKTGD